MESDSLEVMCSRTFACMTRDNKNGSAEAHHLERHIDSEDAFHDVVHWNRRRSEGVDNLPAELRGQTCFESLPILLNSGRRVVDYIEADLCE